MKATDDLSPAASWRKKHRAHLAKYQNEYYHRHHEKIREQRNAYYAEKRNAARTPEEKIALCTKRAISALPKKKKENYYAEIRNIKQKARYATLPTEEKEKVLQQSAERYKQKYDSDPEFRAKRLAYLKEWRAKKKK